MKPLIISIFLLISILVQSQETKLAFTDKDHQLSISTEYLALSFSYANKIKPKLNIGAQIQLGLGSRFLLSGSNYKYNDQIITYGDQYLVDKPDVFDHHVDVIKFQVFLRPALSKRFYLDIGPYISYGAVFTKNNETISSADEQFSFGLETSVFYTFWKMHIGSRIQLAKQFSGSAKPKTYYYGLFLSPIVIGFNF